MSNIDMHSIDLLATEKVVQKVDTHLCSIEGCNIELTGKATLCRGHKAAETADRYSAYRDIVRAAATLANTVSADTDIYRVFVRIDKGTSGFAYFAKDVMPKYYVPARSKATPDGHTFGGTLLQGFDSIDAAIAFAASLNDSDVSTSEGWKVEVIVKP